MRITYESFLALCSNLAYRENEIKETFNEKSIWHFDPANDIIKDDATETLCYFIYTYEIPENLAIVLVFRGSDNLTNWYMNTQNLFLDNFPNENSPIGKVGRGFKVGWDALKNRVYTRLSDIATMLQPKFTGPGSMPLYITGHSLGAALSILAISNIAYDQNNKRRSTQLSPRPFSLKTYTYANPVIGDKNFVDNYARLFSYREIEVSQHYINRLDRVIIFLNSILKKFSSDYSSVDNQVSIDTNTWLFQNSIGHGIQGYTVGLPISPPYSANEDCFRVSLMPGDMVTRIDLRIFTGDSQDVDVVSPFFQLPIPGSKNTVDFSLAYAGNIGSASFKRNSNNYYTYIGLTQNLQVADFNSFIINMVSVGSSASSVYTWLFAGIEIFINGIQLYNISRPVTFDNLNTSYIFRNETPSYYHIVGGEIVEEGDDKSVEPYKTSWGTKAYALWAPFAHGESYSPKFEHGYGYMSVYLQSNTDVLPTTRAVTGIRVYPTDIVGKKTGRDIYSYGYCNGKEEVLLIHGYGYSDEFSKDSYLYVRGYLNSRTEEPKVEPLKILGIRTLTAKRNTRSNNISEADWKVAGTFGYVKGMSNGDIKANTLIPNLYCYASVKDYPNGNASLKTDISFFPEYKENKSFINKKKEITEVRLADPIRFFKPNKPKMEHTEDAVDTFTKKPEPIIRARL